jgi:hypothetical protein
MSMLLLGVVLGTSGCEKRGVAEKFGKTFYLDGAGNWGFGASEVPDGLKKAGYVGDVELYIWTSSFNPLIDQLNIANARIRAAILAQKIDAYKKRYPNNVVNVIALSAGTGVATWAIENVKDGEKIDNLVLLGSSLSATYDMTKALRHMRGKIYTYFSPHDQVLATVEVVGTIDGKRGVKSIGQIGLKPPRGMEDRVVNVGWNKGWMRLGWAGAHTDTTNEKFVQYEIAKRLGVGSQADREQSPMVARAHR